MNPNTEEQDDWLDELMALHLNEIKAGHDGKLKAAITAHERAARIDELKHLNDHGITFNPVSGDTKIQARIAELSPEPLKATQSDVSGAAETPLNQVDTLHEQAKATEVYGDVLGCIRNYFYEGWKYRVGPKMQNYDEVNKDSYDAARRMMDNFFKMLRTIPSRPVPPEPKEAK